MCTVTLLVPAQVEVEGAYDPHILEIWDGDEKVFSSCWEDPDQPEVRLCRSGQWQEEFLEN